MTPKDMNNNELIEKYGDLVAGAEHLPIGDAKSLTYMEAYKYRDEIIVDFPRPLTKVENPLTVTGKAKGMWFFEGSFPVELVDESGVSLGKTAAKAQGDWMTSDFVSFKAELNFIKSSSAKGKLIIKNDNPSGEAANQKEVTIPVDF